MLGKYLLLTLATLLLASCADAKYATPNIPVGGGQDQKLNTCHAKFMSGDCVSYAWEKIPTEKEFGSFLLKTFRLNAKDGSAVAVDLDGTLTVVLWMPSMGHGSSPVVVERLDVGTYRVSKAFFIMKGEWEIRVQLKDGNDLKDQAIIPINF